MVCGHKNVKDIRAHRYVLDQLFNEANQASIFSDASIKKLSSTFCLGLVLLEPITIQQPS